MADEKVNIKLVLDATEADKSVYGMRKSIKELSKLLGSSLLSNEDKQQVLGRMGELKEGIVDFQKNVKQLGDDNYFENLATAARPAVAGFEALTSASLLFGGSQKQIEEAQRKVIALIGLMQSLQEISDTKKLKNMVLYRAAQLQEVAVRLVNKARISEEIIAQNTLAASQAKAGIGIKTLTALQKAWNLVMSANPILLIVSALTLLAGGVAAVAAAFSDGVEEVKSWETALDGTVITNDEVLKGHNNNIIAMQKLSIEYDIQSGKITQLEGDLKKLEVQRLADVDAIKKQTDKEVNDAIEEQTGFWSNLWAAMKAGGNVALTTANQMSNAAEAALPIIAAGEGKLKNLNDESARLKQEAIFENQKKEQEKAKEDYKKLIELATDNYNKRRTLLNNFLIDLKTKNQNAAKEDLKSEETRLQTLLQLEREKYDLTVRMAINSFESIKKAQENAAMTGNDSALKNIVASYDDAIKNFMTASEAGTTNLDKIFLNGSEKLQEYLKQVINYQQVAAQSPLDIAKLDELQTKLEATFVTMSAGDREQANNLLVLIDIYKKHQSTIVDIKKEDADYRKDSIKNANEQIKAFEKNMKDVEKTSKNILNSLKVLSPEEALALDNEAITADYEELKNAIIKNYEDAFKAIKTLSDVDVANRDKYNQQQIDMEKKKADELVQINKEKDDAIALNTKNANDKQKAEQIAMMTDIANSAGNAVLDVSQNLLEASLNNQIDNISKKTEAQKERFEAMVEAGAISAEEAAARSKALDEKSAKDRAKLENKIARQSKIFAVSQTIFDGIMAVAKAMSAAPPPANIPLMTMAGIQAAIQTTAALAQPVPQASYSYKVGTTAPLANDQIAQLHKGEHVASADALALNPALGMMIEAGNKKQTVQMGIDYDRLASAMANVNLQPRVYVDEITTTANRVKNIEGYATYKN